MNIRIHSAFVLLLVALLSSANAFAAPGRHGIILELKPIENRGDDQSQEVKQRKANATKVAKVAIVASTFLGAFGKHRQTEAEQIASQDPDSASAIVGEVAGRVGDKGPTTRYAVKVKLDKGKVLNITQLRTSLGDLKVGSRVIVEGVGDQARVLPEK